MQITKHKRTSVVLYKTHGSNTQMPITKTMQITFKYKVKIMCLHKR